MTAVVTKPGIYRDIDERVYHSDPTGHRSLSSTEAKLLLEAPAMLHHYRQSPRAPRPEFDFGSAVHSLVLGVGAHLERYPEDVLSASGSTGTKAAREWAEAVRAEGGIPLKADVYDAVHDCAAAVTNHPLCRRIFADGDPEVSVFSEDAGTGVWMRGRLDWIMPPAGGDGAHVLVDLKTTDDAQPDAFTRAAARYGYDVQRAWYRRIWRDLTSEDARFLHVVVSKRAPYLVSVCEMDWSFDDLGKVKVEKALRLYRDCLDSGDWPGIPAEVHQISAPAYYLDSDKD